MLEVIVLLVAVIAATSLGVAAVLRKRQSLASWCFLAGMIVLAADVFFGVLVILEDDLLQRVEYQALQLLAKSFLIGPWLAFSLIYSRGEAKEFLRRWRTVLVLAILVPPAVATVLHEQLVLAVVHGAGMEPALIVGPAAKALFAILLLGTVLSLVNLEKTFRAAVGTVRWRVKYLVIGAGLIFGVRVYTLSQGMLFRSYDSSFTILEAVALILGCLSMGVTYLRRGFADLDIYPSRAVLQGSFTVLVAGVYLFGVGILAQLLTALNIPVGLAGYSFVILVAFVGLAALLCSNRFRSSVKKNISRHFKRPDHDSRKIWTDYTQTSFGVMEPEQMCRAAAEVISRAFEVLTIRVLLIESDTGEVRVASSTFEEVEVEENKIESSPELVSAMHSLSEPVLLGGRKQDRFAPLEEFATSQFSHGGRQMAVPLRSAERIVGAILLGDRVGGRLYSQEEKDIISCLGDQLASNLLNLQLMAQRMESKELEAFQTMSTFFVHDLKNAANSLGLMLQNLPVHFDDPEFRKDALRGLGKAAGRINSMIARLGQLRSQLDPEKMETDLNELVEEVLDEMALAPPVALNRSLSSIPALRLDQGQIKSVITNLLANAVESCNGNPTIHIGTGERGGRVMIEVSDNGCGMSPEFIRTTLFKPFMSTKSKGLGIGMFQSKMIVEAHDGSIEVESEEGRGTHFRIIFPKGTTSKQKQ